MVLPSTPSRTPSQQTEPPSMLVGQPGEGWRKETIPLVIVLDRGWEPGQKDAVEARCVINLLIVA